MVALALAVVLTQPAGAAPGDLDPSFGGDGKLALPAAGAFVARAVAIDDRSRIVVAGYLCEPVPGGDGTCLAGGNASFRLARLTRDGGLDPEFGANGFVTTPLGDGRSQAYDVVADPQGRLVAAGVARIGDRDVFALARYHSNGALDTSFGDGGTALVPAGASYASLGDVELGPGGTLLASGQAVDGLGNPRMVVARFTGAGELDTSFGTSGVTAAPPPFGYALALAVTRAGQALVAGVAGSSPDARNYRFGAQRLTVSGLPDGAFDGDGYLERSLGRSSSFATAAAALPGGALIAAGAATVADGRQAMAVMRTHADGSPDSRFGNGGTSLVALGEGAVANDLVLDRAGRALVTGQAARGGGYQFAVVRLGVRGRPEAGFGDGGATSVAWGAYPVARATAAALQGRDRLVIVGLGCNGGSSSRCEGGTPVLLVARLDAGEPVPAVSVPSRVTRRMLRRGMPVNVRLASRARCEAWLIGRRRGSARRVTLAHIRSRDARATFSWRLRASRRALRRTRSGELRLAIRAGGARVTRTITLAG